MARTPFSPVTSGFPPHWTEINCANEFSIWTIIIKEQYGETIDRYLKSKKKKSRTTIYKWLARYWSRQACNTLLFACANPSSRAFDVNNNYQSDAVLYWSTPFAFGKERARWIRLPVEISARKSKYKNAYSSRTHFRFDPPNRQLPSKGNGVYIQIRIPVAVGIWRGRGE